MTTPRRSTGFLLAFAVVLSACGATQESGATATATAQEGASSAPLSFTPETGSRATGTVTLEDGGTVTATASDGTTFELVVPAEAVPGATDITMTPLADIEGVDAGPIHAVLLEPDGLEFAEPARLTITPAEPIPLEDQLMFEAAGDGDSPQLALIDPASEPIVILLEHFSVAGIATASEAQRALFLEKSAANAEARLNSQVRARIGDERYRQLTGEERTGAIEREALDDIAAEYQREVLDKRRAAAAESCRALRTYVKSVISWERQWQLTGVTEEEEAASLARVAEAVQYAHGRHDECEQEAIAACQDAGDSKILVDFWLWIDDPVDKARADELCGQDYQADKTITNTEMNVTYSVHYTGTKCGGHEGDWLIEYENGTWSAYGATAYVSGNIVVTIAPGSMSGPAEGTISGVFPDGTVRDTTFSGTATFVEDPPELKLDITSSSPGGAIFGFLDTGVLEPGTLSFPLEVGDFCS